MPGSFVPAPAPSVVTFPASWFYALAAMFLVTTYSAPSIPATVKSPVPVRSLVTAVQATPSFVAPTPISAIGISGPSPVGFSRGGLTLAYE